MSCVSTSSVIQFQLSINYSNVCPFIEWLNIASIDVDCYSEGPTGSVVFDIAVQSRNPLSGSQQAYLAFILWEDLKLAGSALTISGQIVPFDKQPDVVYNPPTGQFYTCK